MVQCTKGPIQQAGGVSEVPFEALLIPTTQTFPP